MLLQQQFPSPLTASSCGNLDAGSFCGWREKKIGFRFSSVKDVTCLSLLEHTCCASPLPACWLRRRSVMISPAKPDVGHHDVDDGVQDYSQSQGNKQRDESMKMMMIFFFSIPGVAVDARWEKTTIRYWVFGFLEGIVNILSASSYFLMLQPDPETLLTSFSQSKWISVVESLSCSVFVIKRQCNWATDFEQRG